MTTMPGDVRLGTMMFVGRAALQMQNALGDPAGRVLGRGPNTDPYGRYERVRTEGDLVRSRLGVYLSASHELVNSVLRDSRFGVQTSRGNGRDEWQMASGKVNGAVHPIDDSFLSLDPPRHTRLRRMVAPWFAPRALRDRTERIEAIVHRFLDDLAGRDRFDLIGDFAVRVPIQVICDLLGVPDAEYPRFIRWGAIVALALDSVWTLGDYRQLRVALAEMSAFFTDLVEYRKRHPGDDVVSELVATGAPLAVDDLLATVELLLVAGFETTVNLIGNGVLALLRDNEARAWLLAHPEQADDLVEEVLRHDPPVQYTMRLSHEPVNLAGTVLPTDTPVVLLLAGANRDPNVFADPGRFDPTRPNNREHLAFSAGIHYCLGAGLARIEAAVALRALFERYPDLRVAGAVKRRRSRNIRGVRQLPVRGTAVRTLLSS
jgi:cytochrome P450